SAGAACNEGGGNVCNGTGSCVVAPFVVTTSPSDGSSPIAGNAISVTFSRAMNPTTLTGQTSAGSCSGSVQLSLDNFSSCVAFSSSAAAMSGGNTIAAFTAAPGVLVNRSYKIRVSTSAQDPGGNPLPSIFTQTAGFSTVSPNLCDGSLVVSQVYGGG